ncbi:YaiO family outer membrane beta-barrel protein [Olivibacter jilunii]|uniref:YaiO family outer membrane beta-barrel protein n=1 Tax=Olivibacter jilunii TaxID=985016 RepID=UPI003F188701
MKGFTFIIVMFFSANFLTAQEQSTQDPDSLLTLATKEYRAGRPEKALAYTQKGLAIAPQYHDIRMVETRAYMALSDMENAKKDMTFLITHAPQYPEMKELLYQFINHYNNPVQQLKAVESYQSTYPEDLHLQALKAYLLLENKQKKAAQELSRKLLKEKGLSGQDQYQLQVTYKRSITNEVGIGYQYIGFSSDYINTEPWQTVTLEYQRNINRTAIIGRTMLSGRDERDGQFYEVEAYPVFSKRFYTLVSAGVSSGTLFPDFRGSLSGFYNFAPKWEGEAGMRYASANGDGYFTGIAGLSLYEGNIYINAKTFLGPKRAGRFIQNYQLNLRYYLNDADSYGFIIISSGISPDERTIYTQLLENPTLKATMFGGGIRKTLGIHHLIQASFNLMTERITTTSGQQYISNVAYRYRF